MGAERVPFAPLGIERSKSEERYWGSYLRIGFMVLAGESLGTLAYFRMSPSGAHRSALMAIASLAALLALGALPLTGRVARRTWRAQFSLGAAVLSGIVLALCAHLDGGLDSPLLFLLALPLAHAALGLRVRAVMVCAVVTVVDFALIAITDPSVSRSTGDLVVLSTFLAGIIALALGWAIGRVRLQRDEAGLWAQVALLTETDTLTGCLNHGAFFDRLAAEINRAMRHAESLCLLVADVDLFKAFNDAHGHAAGDDALAVVGTALRRGCRDFDVTGRVGGDEFAVVLPGTSLAGARRVAARLVQALERPGGLGITVSIGAAALDRAEPTAMRLFRDADTELYRAKANGRGCFASAPDHGATARHDGGAFGSDDARVQADVKRLLESVREAKTATAEAHAILDTLESSNSVGFAFISPDYRIIRINPVLAAVNGGLVEDQLGKTVAEVVPGLWPTLEPTYRSVLETGESFNDGEVVEALPSATGHQRYWLTNLSPVRASGVVIGICIVAIDITDRKELEQSQTALTQAVVEALAGTVELRDPYTAGHQEHVARIAVAIATELGRDAGEIHTISLAARIHDIGKLAVPVEILVRPGSLGKEEMALVRTHSRAGAAMLGRVGFPAPVREMVLQHHERLDGSGYPDGLRGDQISMGARIVAVADVVDAIASHRPYRPALGMDIALQEVQKGAGTLFDREVVAACLRLFGDGYLPVDGTARTTLQPTELR